ncbi:MAG TPA: hypothetical protein VGG34_08065 [Opitutaceae bacterium]|jgi:hypothetical protein
MDETPISLPPWLPWATTACLAALAACLGELWAIERMRVRQMGDEAALAAASLQATQNQLEAERIVSRREIDDLKGAATGLAPPAALLVPPGGGGGAGPWGVVAGDQSLLCGGLARADANHYELWAVLGDGSSVAMAAFEGTGSAQRVRLRAIRPGSVIRDFLLLRTPGGASLTLEDAKAQGLIILASASDTPRK